MIHELLFLKKPVVVSSFCKKASPANHWAHLNGFPTSPPSHTTLANGKECTFAGFGDSFPLSFGNRSTYKK